MKKSNIIVSIAIVFHILLFALFLSFASFRYRILNSVKSEVKIVEGNLPVFIQDHANPNSNVDLGKVEGLIKESIIKKASHSADINTFLLLADSEEYDCNFTILSYNKSSNSMKLIAIPGSMTVFTQSYGNQRLSDVYRFLGIGGAINTLNYCYDLDIQQYGFMDFDGVCNNLDRLGAVRVELSQDEVRLLNMVMRTPLPERNGKHSLTFEQVVQFINLDFGSSRNNEIINACIERIKSQALLHTMYEIIMDKNSQISTNISILNLYELSSAALKRENRVDYMVLPIENSYEVGIINGKYALLGDIEENAFAINAFLYGNTHIS